MSIKIWAYQPYSESAKALAQSLGVKRIVSEDYRIKGTDHIINWGKSYFNSGRTFKAVLNHPHNVSLAVNKVSSFGRMALDAVPTVEFTFNQTVAQLWLDTGCRVVARTLIASYGGQGAVLVSPGEELPDAPLYTKYFRRDHEYRVHVFKGEIIDYARKKRRNGYTQSLTHNDAIRSYDNGWVYCRDGIVLNGICRISAINAVNSLSLDFGAVDVLYRERDDRVAVLEVNTAPGLTGRTLISYTNAIWNYTRGLYGRG